MIKLEMEIEQELSAKWEELDNYDGNFIATELAKIGAEVFRRMALTELRKYLGLEITASTLIEVIENLGNGEE